jgi:hypothetical protein
MDSARSSQQKTRADTMRVLFLFSIGLACCVPVTIRAVWISYYDYYGKPESKMYGFVYPLFVCGFISTIMAFYYLIREERRKQSKRE